MKILYINPTGSLGGAERSLLDLMWAIRKARPDWNLGLLVGSDGALASAAKEMGVSVDVLPLPPSVSRLGDAGAGGPAGDAISKSSLLAAMSLSAPQLTSYLWKLHSLLSERGPNLIHSNGFKTHILTALAAPPRSKVIWHVRDYVGARPMMSRLMRFCAGRCAAAIANSHSVARDLDTVCHGRLQIHTVYNAVDLDRFNPCGPKLDLDALSGLLPAAEGTLRAGLVATMARWKGQEVFLQALSMLHGNGPIRGYVIGGPIYATAGSQYSLDELRNLGSCLGLNGNAGFTGYVNDVASAIRALDIVVHASTRPEPFGRVVAEAMACGKPVLISNAGGVGEIVSENEVVLGHTPGDAGALAESIARLSANSDLRKKLGAEGRRWAEERFQRDRLAREVLSIYNSIAQAHS